MFSESTIIFKMVMHCFASVMYNKACMCDMVIKDLFCLRALMSDVETIAADCQHNDLNCSLAVCVIQIRQVHVNSHSLTWALALSFFS